MLREDSIPALEGEALRKFKQVTDFQGGAESGVKDKKGTKIRTAEVPPAKRTGEEQPQEPKLKASKKSSEETASSSSDVRPAGAEAAAVEKPAPKPQPKPTERPAGAVADSTTPATEKPAVKAKAMPKAPPKAPPMPKGATSPLSENQVVALQSREVPGASRLDHLSSDQVWLSRRISGLLRGWEHTNKRNRVPPPAFQKGLWMEFSHVYMYIKKKYRQSLTIDDMLVVLTSNHRFMMEIKVAPKGTLVGGRGRTRQCDSKPFSITTTGLTRTWKKRCQSMSASSCWIRSMAWPNTIAANSLVCQSMPMDVSRTFSRRSSITTSKTRLDYFLTISLFQ